MLATKEHRIHNRDGFEVCLKQTHLNPVSGILVFVFCALSWLFLPCPLHAADTPKPKLALCASGDKKAGDIVELMAVPLSKDGKVDLLDRASINKVLSEQKMALSGMLSMEDALKAGQLLQCDIFAELHCEKVAAGSPDVMSLVAFDALTGVRLCDSAVQGEYEIQKVGESAIRPLVIAVKKWQGGGTGEKCRTVSLVSVRNVDLPVSLSDISSAIGPILERQLLQSPEISVMERKRLEYVNKEAEISGERRDRLLASSVLLDLDVSRKGSKGEIVIRALMSDPSGKEIAVVVEEGDSGKLVDALQNLSERMISAMKLSPISHDNSPSGLEADRLVDEIRRLEKRGGAEERIVGLEEAALALAESALLKEPDNVQHQKRVSMLERRRFPRLMRAKRYDEALALFDRDLKQCVGWRIDTNRRRRPMAYADDTHQLYGDAIGMLDKLYSVRHSLSNATQNTFREYRKMFKQWWKEECLSKSHFEYGYYMDWDCQAWDETPDERVQDLRYSPWFPWIAYDPTIGGTTPCRELFGTLTPVGKRDLLAHLERWSNSTIQPVGGHWWPIVDGRRMASYLQIAELAHAFPDFFENAGLVVSSNIHAALGFAIMQPQAVRMHTVTAVLNSFTLPTERTVPEVIAVVKHMEQTGYNAIDFLLWLDSVAQSEKSKQEAEKQAERQARMAADRRRMDDFLNGVSDARPTQVATAMESGAACRTETIEPEQGYYLKQACDQARNMALKWHREQPDRAAVLSGLSATYRQRFNADLPTETDRVATIAPWNKQELWFETQATNKTVIEAAAIEGETLYALLRLTSPQYGYEIHAIGMHSGTRRKLAFAKTDRGRSGPLYVGSQCVHLPTDNGIISFPVDGSKVRMWTDKNGLPSCSITSCAEIDGILYVGATVNGEGCFASVNLDGTGGAILAASGRKEKKSDLDDRTSFRIVNMVHDKAAHRLLLNVNGREDRPVLAGGEPIADYYEFKVWAYDLTAKSISRVAVRKSTSRVVGRNLEKVTGFIGGEHAGDGPRLLPDGRWAYNEYLLMVFDNAVTEEKRLVGPVLPPGHDKPLFTDGAWGGASLAGTVPWGAHTLFLSNGTGWKVLMVKDGKTLAADLPKLGDAYPFFLWVYEDRLIACTPRGVWALAVGPLPEERMKETKKE